jgi:hypothetical protein
MARSKPPLRRDHVLVGHHTLRRGKLTFLTAGPLLASEALKALAADREFTVCVAESNGLTGVTGKVLSVELVMGAMPAQWEIVMRAPLNEISPQRMEP